MNINAHRANNRNWRRGTDTQLIVAVTDQRSGGREQTGEYTSAPARAGLARMAIKAIRRTGAGQGKEGACEDD